MRKGHISVSATLSFVDEVEFSFASDNDDRLASKRSPFSHQ